MTDLMREHHYRGWYIGIMDEDTYAMQEKETQEFGPFSKNMAKKVADIFNRIAKRTVDFKGVYAVAISGREALTEMMTEREEGSWSRNP